MIGFSSSFPGVALSLLLLERSMNFSENAINPSYPSAVGLVWGLTSSLSFFCRKQLLCWSSAQIICLQRMVLNANNKWKVFVIVPKNLAAGNFFRASSCSGESLLVTSQSALGQLARQQADGFKSQSIFRLQVTTWENLSASGHYFALSSLLCETIFTKRKSHQKLSFPDAEKFLDDVRFSQHVPNMTHGEFFLKI